MEVRNVRRAPPSLPMQLALPLDAKADKERAHRPVDVILAALVIAIIGFGVVMVYSASTVQATLHYHDPQFFLKRQAAYAIASLLVFGLVSLVDYHRLYKLTYPVLGLVGVLLSCASRASVTRAAARRVGSRSARCTSSPPRWRSSRSSRGSRIRSRRRPSA